MSSARIEDCVDRDAADPLAAPPANLVESKTADISAVESTPRTVVRHVTAELRGSLTKLATGGTAVKWSLDDSAHAVFGPSAADKGFSADSEDCDIKNAVLHELSVVALRSNFPCALGLSITGVAGTHFSKVRPPLATAAHDPRAQA